MTFIDKSFFMNVIITGASKGIGKAIATIFAAENATLFLCSRNEEKLKLTAQELKAAHNGCIVHYKAADLADKNAAKEFANWCLQFAVPDILVNNAGQYVPGNIYNEAENNLEKMISTNLYSAYHVTKTVIEKMIAAKRGHIFNICSTASLQAYANGGSYSISKFALMGFSKNLREELKAFGIKVTSVYPGAVMTDSWGDFDNAANRIMETDDVAKMILACSKLSAQAVIEDIVLRPQLGDL